MNNMVEDIPQMDINPPTMIRSNEHHALAIEHNGLVFVKTPAAWHELAKALEVARADLESETRWAKQYHDEVTQLHAEIAQLKRQLQYPFENTFENTNASTPG